jgi:hypothetical protein
MEQETIIEIRDILKHSVESRNWGFVEEAIEALNEILEEEFQTTDVDGDE